MHVCSTVLIMESPQPCSLFSQLTLWGTCHRDRCGCLPRCGVPAWPHLDRQAWELCTPGQWRERAVLAAITWGHSQCWQQPQGHHLSEPRNKWPKSVQHLLDNGSVMGKRMSLSLQLGYFRYREPSKALSILNFCLPPIQLLTIKKLS